MRSRVTARISARARLPWLTTRTALRLLNGCDQNSEYAEFMSVCAAQEERTLFEHGSKHDARIVASPEFLENLPRHLRVYRSKLTLEQIIQTVTCRLGVDREHVLSNSRQREVTLARALIAWYATERRVATLSEVARYLRRDPSTLSVAVSRYRLCRPELFKLTALHDVVPLAQIQLQVSEPQWEDEVEVEESEEELYSNAGRATTTAMRVGAGASPLTGTSRCRSRPATRLTGEVGAGAFVGWRSSTTSCVQSA